MTENALNHGTAEALVKSPPADTSTNSVQKRCITVSAKGKVGKWIKRMRSELGERVVRQKTSHKSWAGVNVPSGCKSVPPLRNFPSAAAFIISAAIKLTALP